MSSSLVLTKDQLQRFCPGGRRDILEGLVRHSYVLADYGLTDNKLRLCHFLAQAAHETAGFRTLVEYGSNSYFRARYGHRRDLGNRNRADGPRFRGRGIFQLTGRANYRRYGKILGIDLEADPLLARDPGISLRIACEYWRHHGLNTLADRNNLGAITRRINGGLNGLRDRRRYLQRAMKIWLPGLVASPQGNGGLLRYGDSGPAVAMLQRRLRAIGFRIAVDGLFGPRTRRALIRFQKRNHLWPDGLFGPRSKRLLRQKTARQRPDIHWQGPCDMPRPHSANRPQETNMNQWKSYLSSRTIWANIIGFSALILGTLGFNGIAASEQTQLVEQILKLIEAGGFISGVIFRALARHRLGPDTNRP